MLTRSRLGLHYKQIERVSTYILFSPPSPHPGGRARWNGEKHLIFDTEHVLNRMHAGNKKKSSTKTRNYKNSVEIPLR